MTSTKQKDVIIIGAGASGPLCAAECGRRGRSVLVLDHAPRAGSKVLISGGGWCNFTNLNADHGRYCSRNPHFCRSVLARFTPRDILFLTEKHHDDEFSLSTDSGVFRHRRAVSPGPRRGQGLAGSSELRRTMRRHGCPA